MGQPRGKTQRRRKHGSGTVKPDTLDDDMASSSQSDPDYYPSTELESSEDLSDSDLKEESESSVTVSCTDSGSVVNFDTLTDDACTEDDETDETGSDSVSLCSSSCTE